ncbi:asparagine synthase (glutamine-hydrolyzing) [Burkholderiaceae bacterium]|nr:asparagine synthase (glutamine-hydrolyzing) [Burkholderiaceae bacterium]
MCGLLGYWSEESIVRPIFNSHLTRIGYRGPDHSEVTEVDGLFLGHNRLAILDLDPRSNQPMLSACGRVTLVFNGEIYNYMDLKTELEGYPFRTDSDTEVIIAAYLTWGESFAKHLSGMFSIALYDRQQKRVILARDPIGKKPLYFSYGNGFLAFASEIKALTGLPRISLSLNNSSVNEFFSAGFVGGGRTVYEAISQLPAGHLASFTLPVCAPPRMTRYWTLPVVEQIPHASEEELIDELDALLLDAVRLRLRSDVPVGVFLSGGLDSSLIAALAARISSKPLLTFTIGFAGTSSDESKYATQIAEYFGTRHAVHDVGEDMLSVLPKLIAELDQPFADSSFVPMYFVSREARRDVTVALSGDGGDELFAGYGHYDAFAWENEIREGWPRMLRRLLGYCAAPLPERHRSRTLKRLAIDDPYASMGAYASRFFSFNERKRLLCGPVSAEPTPELEFLARFLPGIDWLQNICQADFQGYMVDDILVKVDRMSMLNSLEVRSPFLDKRIAEFAFSKVPSALKRRGMEKKYLLKQLARRYLPSDFQFERKHGFGVPLGQWFNKALGDRLSDLLFDAPSGYVDRDQAMRYLKSHRRGLSNYSKKLFAILIWEEWFANQRRPKSGL